MVTTSTADDYEENAWISVNNLTNSECVNNGQFTNPSKGQTDCVSIDKTGKWTVQPTSIDKKEIKCEDKEMRFVCENITPNVIELAVNRIDFAF